MGLDAIFDSRNWAPVPFHFWSAAFFVFGCVVGSFLNVCIYRLPLGQSIVSPPSHCPHCQYSIPWYLNIPLVTWLMLRGKCRNCGAPISFRYFVVELLTASLFLGCWLVFGQQGVALALVYCLFLGGLIVASFIDAEYIIIPDQITLGGIGVGFLCSLFLPALHEATGPTDSLKQCLIGIGFGSGLIYLILRLGKLFLGRQRLRLSSDAKVVFTETAVVLPEKEIPYEELFYRRSDVIALDARMVEMVDRCYRNVMVRLTPEKLQIGDDEFDPEQVLHLEAVTGEILLPREAMGLGDVKFMGAIGAFLGWQAVAFSLMVSAMIGGIMGLTLIALNRKEWSSRIPYGPYIAVAATIWIFGGRAWWDWLFKR